MRLACTIKGHLKREAIPSLTDLGMKETDLELEEERLKNKNSVAKPLHKSSDAEQFVALLEEMK